METVPPAGGRAAGGPVPAWVKALVAAGLVCFGISSPLVRLAGDTPALAIAAWRCLMVTVLLAPAALARERATFAAMPAREWALVLAAGVALGVHFIAWIVSVQLTTVAAASVLVTTTPLWIAVLGVVTVRERPDRATLLAIGAGVAGAALIGAGSVGEGVAVHAALGNALALGAAVLVSVYLLVGRAVRQRRTFLAYFAPVNAIAAVVALGACLALDVPLALPLPVGGAPLLSPGTGGVVAVEVLAAVEVASVELLVAGSAGAGAPPQAASRRSAGSRARDMGRMVARDPGGSARTRMVAACQGAGVVAKRELRAGLVVGRAVVGARRGEVFRGT